MTVLVGDEGGIRAEWSRLLNEELERQGMTREQLRVRLNELGCLVKRQTVDGWITNRWAPRPTHQAAICAVLKVPHTSLFPVSTFVEGRR